MSFKNYIKQCWIEGTQISKANIMTAAYVGGLAHSSFYFIYRDYFHLAENVYLRFATVFLCISVASYYRLPQKIIRKYFPFYWHLVLIMAIPLVITYNTFCTNFNEAWLYWEIFGVFLLVIYVPNIVIFFIDLLIGISGAFLLYKLTMPTAVLSPNFNFVAFAIVVAFTIGTGTIFVYSSRITLFNRQKDQDQQVISLFNSISQELRNPLNATKLSILNISEFIPDEKTDGSVVLNKEDVLAISRYKNVANNSIKTANDIIDNSLDNLKGKKINTKLFTHLSAADVVRKAVEEYGYKDNSEREKIIIKLKEDFIFNGQESLAIYTLFNLIRNALYYLLPFPHSTITITTKPGKDYNRIYVYDNGPGIPEEKLESLFQNFNIIRKIGGTGLGLSFCKRTMIGFGGDIKCSSELGKYTEFVLEFPKVAAIAYEVKETSTKSDIAVLREVNANNVLLVDDQQVNIQIVKLLIEKNLESTSCDIANNGAEAIEKIKENEYDVILMDIQMPMMDGVTATKKIREFNDGVPIIAYSSKDTTSNIRQAKNTGFNDYVIKPIIHEILLKTISKWGFIEYKKSDDDKSFSMNNKKILFADDQDVNRMLTANYLKKRGATIEEVVNGKQALEKAISDDYDIILMDIQMPIMDGITATTEIKKFRMENKMKHIPIIAVSGDSEKTQVLKLLSSGFDDYFIKGQNQHKLLKTIDFYLKYTNGDAAKNAASQELSLIDTTEIDKDLLKEIKPIFIKEAFDRINDIKKAKETNNIGEFLLVSHALKGICGNIGAKALFDYSTEMNNLAKNGKWPQENDWFEKLEDLYNKTKKALENF